MTTEVTETKYLSFIKANSKIFFYSIIVLIFLIIASLWLINKSQSEKVKVSEDYIKAQFLIEQNSETEAKEILNNIIKKKNNIYSSLSLFLMIDKNLEKDSDTVLSHFDYIINNNSYPKEDLNLLRLKKAIYISDIQKEQEIIELLNPLINSDSVWKTHALKFLGDFYYSFNQFQKAKQYYSMLLQDEEISKVDINRKIKLIDNE